MIILIIIMVIGLDYYPLFKKILFLKIVRYLKERKRNFEKSFIF